MESTALVECFKYLAMGIAIGLGVLGPGLGIGLATKALLESVARQPEATGSLTGLFLLGAALAETCAIYAFVVVFIIKG